MLTGRAAGALGRVKPPTDLNVVSHKGDHFSGAGGEARVCINAEIIACKLDKTL